MGENLFSAQIIERGLDKRQENLNVNSYDLVNGMTYFAMLKCRPLSINP